MENDKIENQKWIEAGKPDSVKKASQYIMVEKD